MSGPSAERINKAMKRLLRIGRPVYCGGPHGNAVALTFDDGPGAYTHFVLKRLRRNHARATFFLTTKTLAEFGSLVPKELEFGEVGDHTRTHPFLPGLSPEAQRSEIVGAETAIEHVAKRQIRLFRPPYGGRNARIDAIAKRRGMVQILWNVDSADSLGAGHKDILKNVRVALHPGSIILMHDGRGQTVRALPPILHALKRRHLRAVTVPELMASDPPSAEQLRKGYDGCPHYRELGNTLTEGRPLPQ